MVSASRSFGYVLRRVVVAATASPHSSSRRAHTLSASSAALLRQAAGRRKLAWAGTRCLSTETPAAAPPRAQGSTLFQRLSSFLAGVGVTSIVGFYFLYQDVKRSTELVKASLGDVARRVDALEK